MSLYLYVLRSLCLGSLLFWAMGTVGAAKLILASGLVFLDDDSGMVQRSPRFPQSPRGDEPWFVVMRAKLLIS